MDYDLRRHRRTYSFCHSSESLRGVVRAHISLCTAASGGRHLPRYRGEGLTVLVCIRACPFPACRNIQDIHIPAAGRRHEPARLQDRAVQGFCDHGPYHIDSDGHHRAPERDRLSPGVCGLHIHALQGRPVRMAYIHGRNGHIVVYPDHIRFSICGRTYACRSGFAMYMPVFRTVQMVADSLRPTSCAVRVCAETLRPGALACRHQPSLGTSRSDVAVPSVRSLPGIQRAQHLHPSCDSVPPGRTAADILRGFPFQ